MRSRRGHQEHEEAVARRLAQLSAELAASRDDQAAVAPAAGGEWWDGHTRIAPVRPPLSVVTAPPTGPPPGWVPGVAPPGAAIDPPEPPLDPEPEPGSPVVPTPGRHAARRTRRVLTEAVPEPLRGRVWLGPAQVTVLAVLVAVGLAATTWWVVRGDAEVAPTAAPVVPASTDGLVALPDATTEASPGASGAAGSSGAATGTVTVDVAGKVRRPGIAVLDAGARVVDALEAAGGARPGVDLSALNLARVLVDGEQVLVGSAAAPAPVLTGAPAPGPTGALVNLNHATQADLETLPEVGPVTALAILAWRDEHGGFSSVEELLEVDGIGDATLAQIAPHVTI